MAITFGKTWWGNRWLDSLTHIDYENRIPRGAAYARKGAVKDIRMSGNFISAKVAGSGPRPYKVTLVIPPFFPEQIARLIDAIVVRPALISKLLNRQLDPQLLALAEGVGLHLFPRRWSDFKMVCDCPDWAVPCKHLAAVIYMLSQEIDNNPFRVFEMHNVDLIGELEKRGLVIESQKSLLLPTLSSKFIPKAPSHEEGMGGDFKRIDFSGLSDLTEPLINLLPDEPVFYNRGNFKEKYALFLSKISKNAQRVFTKNLLPEGIFQTCQSPEPLPKRAHVSLNVNEQMEGTVSLSWDLGSRQEKLPTYSLEELAWALHQIHPDFLADYELSVAALHQTYYGALNLLAKGAVIPELVQLADKTYAIYWQPAYMDAQVVEMLAQLEAIFPENTVRATLKKPKKPIGLENQASTVLSLFLNVLIAHLSTKTTEDPFLELFFQSIPYAFGRPGEQEYPGGIKTWLDRFKLGKGTYRPLFMIDETDTGFNLNLAVEHPSDGYLTQIPLAAVLTDEAFKKERFAILQEIGVLAPFVEGLDEYIDGHAKKPIPINLSALGPFLMKSVPAIRLLNIKVLLPKSLQTLWRPKASLHLTRREKEEGGLIRLDDLLTFDWQIAIGDEVLSVKAYHNVLKQASGLIKFKQNYVYVDEKDLEQIEKVLSSPPKLSKAQLLQAALTEEYQATPVALSPEVRALIKQLVSDEEIALPKAINATLRPYQKRGFAWMYRNMRIGFGSIIADDMGLGKTIQVITLFQKIKDEGGLDGAKALVVAPTGLLTNWEAELERFAPALSVHTYHGAGRELRDFKEDVLLTTYGVLRSDASKLKKRKWEIMVIDEAQNIKNHSAEQSKAVRSIPAGVHIAMSGTPVENRLTEFWSIMEYANKGYLDTISQFKTDFAKPIQLSNDKRCVERFRKITAPFMLRRLKSDKSIIADLPDKVEQDRFAQLTAQQAAVYEKTLESAMAEIEGVQETDQQSLFKRQGLVLQLIMALKQICNHPAQFLKNGDCRPELSGKVELLLDLVQTIVDSQEKVLIFTQFREMGEMLQEFIEQQLGERPMFYHGGCTIRQRQEMVERFQKSRVDRVFILSLKAAGTGLNLTAASHVIHYDLWWNPAVEAQATDRAYRIGQQKNVMVHRFITKHTFEERINEMIQKKKELADLTVTSGEHWIGQLSNKELREIFK